MDSGRLCSVCFFLHPFCLKSTRMLVQALETIVFSKLCAHNDFPLRRILVTIFRLNSPLSVICATPPKRERKKERRLIWCPPHLVETSGPVPPRFSKRDGAKFEQKRKEKLITSNDQTETPIRGFRDPEFFIAVFLSNGPTPRLIPGMPKLTGFLF